MTIDIRRGPAGAGSLLIGFIGVATDGSSSASTFNFVSTLSAQLNSTDSNYVDVINTRLTENNSNVSTAEIRKIHFTDWTTDAGVTTFASATAVRDYINNAVSTADNLIAARAAAPTHTPPNLAVGVGSTFTHKVEATGAVSYFWNSNGFPNNVAVSSYDRRVITGFVTTTGTYQLEFDMVNQVGLTTSYVQLTVT